jgi:hypothetical protein
MGKIDYGTEGFCSRKIGENGHHELASDNLLLPGDSVYLWEILI